MELISHNLAEDIPYIQAKDLTYPEFVKHFRSAREPVIIKGAFDHWSIAGMNLEKLISQYGDAIVSYRHTSGNKSGKFGNLIEKVCQSKAHAPADYLRNIHIASQLPEFYRAISTPNISYVGENWKDSRLLPPHWLGLGRDLVELFVGGAGMSFPVLHIDYWGMDGFVSQIYGKKEFLLLAPDQATYLYVRAEDPLKSTIAQPFDNDVGANPLYAKARKMHLVLEEGETLYNPGWWHTSQMSSANITIIQSAWHQDNWKDLQAEITRTQGHRPWRHALYQLYLNFIYLVKSQSE